MKIQDFQNRPLAKMMKYEIIKEYDEKQFRRITGIKKSTEGEEENRN